MNLASPQKSDRLPPPWRMKCYVSKSGRNKILEWYLSLSDEAQAAFRDLIDGLSQQPIANWTRPDFDMLSQKWNKIGKMRFSSGNVEYRPLGFFGPLSGDYTILYGAEERNRKLTPRDVEDKALKRMKEVKINPEQAIAYRFSIRSR